MFHIMMHPPIYLHLCGLLLILLGDSPKKVEKMGIYQMGFCGVKKKVILIDTPNDSVLSLLSEYG